jgi:hypothetical protein
MRDAGFTSDSCDFFKREESPVNAYRRPTRWSFIFRHCASFQLSGRKPSGSILAWSFGLGMNPPVQKLPRTRPLCLSSWWSNKSMQGSTHDPESRSLQSRDLRLAWALATDRKFACREPSASICAPRCPWKLPRKPGQQALSMLSYCPDRPFGDPASNSLASRLVRQA